MQLKKHDVSTAIVGIGDNRGRKGKWGGKGGGIIKNDESISYYAL